MAYSYKNTLRALHRNLGLPLLLLLSLLIVTSPLQAKKGHPAHPCVGCSLTGSNPVSMWSSTTYTLSGSLCAAAASWTVTCGSIVSFNSTSIVVYFNNTGCTSSVIKALNSTGGTIASLTVTVSASPALTGGSITNPSQAINYGTTPAQINASYPSNGSCEDYSYLWWSSTDNANFYTISGATGQNYQPGALTATTYFKRRTTCGLQTAYTTNTAAVIVYPAVTAGSISPSSQTINYNTTPASLTLSGVSGGNGSYSYQWQSSPDNTFSSPANVGTHATSYTPPALTASAYYRVGVTSNGATAFTGSAFVNVYPQLLVGAITPAPSYTLPYNTSPGALTVGGVSGGNGSYSYVWQYSTGAGYTSIPNTNSATYTPGNLTATTWFQVLVTSNGVTVAGSAVRIGIAPPLAAGIITGPPTPITYNHTATLVFSDIDYGGNCGGEYPVQWMQSTDGSSFQDIPDANLANYTTGNLTSATWFRLRINCGTETSLSNIVLVQVNQQMFTGTITPAAMTITSGTSPGSLTANAAAGGSCSGNYLYLWQQSSDGINFSTAAGVANGQNYTPGNLSATSYFRRQVICGSDTLYTTNKALITIGTLPASLDLNYIRIRDLTKPSVTDTATAGQLTGRNDVRQTTQYFDGLGRHVQTVSKQASPLGKDMVTTVVYDPFEREVTKYLPYVSPSTDGNYKVPFLQEQNAFNTAQFPDDQFFYGLTEYEPSPLNRPLKISSPGASWVGGNRSSTMLYQFNDATDSVQAWSIGYTPGALPVNTGIYGPGQLTRNMTVDEAGHRKVEYKDKDGHVVLKKVQVSPNPGTAHVGWLCTYYVYDDLNNIRFVLQPRAVELINTGSTWTVSQPVADELCFRLEYDARNRVIVKKLPGAGEEWLVYDLRDRLVLSQNGFLRQTHQWQFIKYDDRNRTVMTGLYTDNTYTSQAAMQSYLASQNLGFYETYNAAAYPLYSLANSFPAVTDETNVRSYTFYDDYSFGSWYGTPYAGKDNSYDNLFPSASNTTYPYPQPLTQELLVRGMETGSVNKKINDNNGPITAIYYDNRGRVIQQAAYNFSQGVDVATTQYSFNGQALQTVMRHQKSLTNPQTHTITTTMSYDPAGRLSTVTKAVSSVVNGQTFGMPARTTVTNTYNELGQLRKKYLDNIDSLVYDYNIRDWLTGINKNYVAGSATNYFGVELAYDKAAAAAAGTSYIGLQYNGNIAGTIWKSAGDGVNRKYDFSYDLANRLTGADFNQFNGSGFDKSAKIDFSVSGLSYDANGNILSMKQAGFKIGGSATIDSLTYSYQNNGASNKLIAVTDGANDANSKLGDFHYDPATKGSTDFSYDPNGSLQTDNNKGITSIVYNYLNLPQTINIRGKGIVSYIYDNAGTKLEKATVDSTSVPVKTTVTTYLAGFVYVNDTLQFAGEEEGRARWAFHKYTDGTTGYGFERDFFEKDHLGDTRVILTQQKDTARYLATMEAAYRANENALFYNIPQTSYSRVMAGYPEDLATTNPNDSIAMLNGNPGHIQGPAIILKVMAGDTIDVGARSYYTSQTGTGTNSSITDALNSLASGIVGVTGGSKGAIGDLNNTGSPLFGALNAFITNNDPEPTGKPKAYLNYMFLDNQLNYDPSKSGAIPVGNFAAGSLGTPSQPGIVAGKSGFLYVWVSNETTGWPVYFDNISVQVRTGPLLEETHYYPFGLTMAGISDKALKTNYAENKFRYNKGSELQNKEFSDGSGLEMYATHFRELDPQLGRWWQIDPKCEATINPDAEEEDETIEGSLESFSPYTSMDNDPIKHNDPNGDCPSCLLGGLLAAAIDYGTQVVSNYANHVEHPFTNNISLSSIGTSFVAGALTSGGSILSGTVGKAAVSVGSKLVKNIVDVKTTTTGIKVTVDKSPLNVIKNTLIDVAADKLAKGAASKGMKLLSKAGVNAGSLTKASKSVAKSVGVKITRKLNTTIKETSTKAIKKLETKVLVKVAAKIEKPAVKWTKENTKLE